MNGINDTCYTSIVSCIFCRMIVTVREQDTRSERATHCSFLTNHTHVLLLLATDPAIRIRDIAVRVGITERAAQRILADLVAEGYVDRARVGRRNTYSLVLDRPLPLPGEAEHTVGDLIEALCRSR